MKNQFYFTLLILTGTIVSCTTKSAKLATISLEHMDQNVSPRQDFFQYSNGNWIAKNTIPASESRWGSFNELEQSNKEKLTNILEDAVKNQGDKGSQNQILGAYYASLMNMELRNKQAKSGIENELKTIEKLKTKDEIIGVIAAHHTDGIRSLFGFGVRQDLKRVEKHITYISQGGIGLPNKEYYLNANKKELLNAYEKHVLNSFLLLGENEEKATESSNNVLRIERALADSMMSPADMRIPEKTYNKRSISQVEQLFGAFPFKSYLNESKFDLVDSLIVGNPAFLQQISNLIKTESIQTWKSYLAWNVINHYAQHLDERFVNNHFEFYGKKLSGKKERKPLNETAIDEMTRMEFSELLGKAFIEKHFSKRAKERVDVMVDNLLAVFQERIQGLDWMSEITKKEATIKLMAIGRKLGYPDKWQDFSSLQFSPDNYLENVKASNRLSVKKNRADINQAVDKSKWGMPAHMVNAYYHPLLNEIAFPAGIMQAPFFDENAEDAVNYGRIGMVIGHEFTHGFDDMGSKFAADGTFRNWWTEEDRKLFEEKTKILGETFSSFCPIEGHCVNPNLTMGENIADLGGLTMAYYAYKRTDEFKKNEKRNGFTPDQRFFIAYAQLWKIKYTEEEMKNRIANDPHSPGMYRVNGPLQNCPEFFDAFQVKEGDKMRNSEKKIAKIW
jgi:putative endopeptidase